MLAQPREQAREVFPPYNGEEQIELEEQNLTHSLTTEFISMGC
jgi:hypothetical protein